MAWEHLSVDKPHLVYIILGGFTSLFMLCSSVIKEKFYIGEATVATICGIIFGPHAANLIDPGTWGNVDRITLEFSRIVLVVQCFAVGVELPKAYMERHWRSVVFLLVPVMTFGWLITSLFIWGLMGSHLNWLDSLVCAACVTATDPVLASSVVGKGKFAKRVPKHLRDLLSAESGCNDGMAFPFIYLSLYAVRYLHHADEVAFHWICITILYECVFGAVYGVLVGYIARRAIRYAHERDLIDRESFLVFYFVLALFCAGSGSILGVDDLLVGFACGVGFSNDGWFTEKTEESHVSNVIDLLINLAFFVYFGTIIPWEQYNASNIGITPWRLVVLAILVILFRRIPIMLLLKPVIPDVKTWREGLFAGHFGPIGVGAIFVAILARAELETDSTTPLAVIPTDAAENHHLNIIYAIWPITTFLVITSIIIHGSSIAVFTLGKHINTLTITLSYTQAGDENANWLDRLPRIQSRSKSSMSLRKPDDSDSSLEEKMVESPGGALSIPRNFLRRQKEEDTPRARHRKSRSRNGREYDNIRMGPGGAISASAIRPQASREGSFTSQDLEKSESDTLAAASSSSPEGERSVDDRERGGKADRRDEEPEEEVYQEGDNTIIEDEQGNVLEVMPSSHNDSKAEREANVEREVRRLMSDEDIEHGVSQKQDRDPIEDAKEEVKEEAKEVASDASKGRGGWRSLREHLGKYTLGGGDEKPKSKPPERRHGPARAFRFGRTIIVEDEDGEVIKKYEIPAPEKNELERKQSWVDPQSWVDTEKSKQRMQRMGRMMGMGGGGGGGAIAEEPEADLEAGPSRSTRPRPDRTVSERKMAAKDDEDEDDGIRFTMDGMSRRMSKAEFIKQIQSLDPRARADIIEESDVPLAVKREAQKDAAEQEDAQEKRRQSIGPRKESMTKGSPGRLAKARKDAGGEEADIEQVGSNESRPQGPSGLTLVDKEHGDIPMHSVSADLRMHAAETGGTETAAARRRRMTAGSLQGGGRRSPPPAATNAPDSDSDDDGTERIPPSERRRRMHMQGGGGAGPSINRRESDTGKARMRSDVPETAAERRRREGALGISKEESESDEDESAPRVPPARQGIRFADQVRR